MVLAYRKKILMYVDDKHLQVTSTTSRLLAEKFLRHQNHCHVAETFKSSLKFQVIL